MEMERLEIPIDVVYCSERASWVIFKITDAPISILCVARQVGIAILREKSSALRSKLHTKWEESSESLFPFLSK
jgi:hypothetical protein